MEISCSDLRSRFLHQPPQPSPEFPTLRRFSYPCAPTTCYHHRRFRKPLLTSLLSLSPNNLLPLISSSKTLPTTAHSLPDDAVSGLATNSVATDPALEVMNKAIDVCPALKGSSIFLVGINSAMKTSVGKLLADVLRYYYFDSDDVVEEAAVGESAGKSFKERDEEGFREAETEALKQLSSMGRLVVCAGNGAVQGITNLALLRYGLSVWIDVPLDMVARDVVENNNQLSPLEVFDQLTVLYEEMKGGYATADVSISLPKVATKLGYDDFDAVTKEDMALEVLKEIGKLTRVKKMKEEAARPF